MYGRIVILLVFLDARADRGRLVSMHLQHTKGFMLTRVAAAQCFSKGSRRRRRGVHPASCAGLVGSTAGAEAAGRGA